MSDEEEEKRTNRAVQAVIKQQALHREQVGDFELREARAKAVSAELSVLASLWGLAGPMGLGEKQKARAKAEVLRVFDLVLPEKENP